MTEYPRPPAPPPAKPYPPDRIFAGAYMAFIVVRTILWIVRVPQKSSVGLSGYPPWWLILAVDGVGILVYASLLWVLAHSRHWAFVVTAVLTAGSAYGGARLGNASSAAIACLVLFYVLARLLGLLGPEPLRRTDLS